MGREQRSDKSCSLDDRGINAAGQKKDFEDLEG